MKEALDYDQPVSINMRGIMSRKGIKLKHLGLIHTFVNAFGMAENATSLDL